MIRNRRGATLVEALAVAVIAIVAVLGFAGVGQPGGGVGAVAAPSSLVHGISGVDKRVIVMHPIGVSYHTDTNPATMKWNLQGYEPAFRKGPGQRMLNLVTADIAMGFEKFMFKGLEGVPRGSWVGGNLCAIPLDIAEDIRAVFMPGWRELLAENPNLVLCYYTGSVASADLKQPFTRSTDPSAIDSATDADRRLFRERIAFAHEMGVTEFWFDASSKPEASQKVYDLCERLNGISLFGGPAYTTGIEAYNEAYLKIVPMMARCQYWFVHPTGKRFQTLTFGPDTDVRLLVQKHPDLPTTREGRKAWLRARAEQGVGLIAGTYLDEIAEVATEINDPAVLCLHN